MIQELKGIRRDASSDSLVYSRHSFLERLKAGLGAAGFVAVLSESAMSFATGMLANLVHLTGLVTGQFDNWVMVCVIVLSVGAFFAAALLSHVGRDEITPIDNNEAER